MNGDVMFNPNAPYFVAAKKDGCVRVVLPRDDGTFRLGMRMPVDPDTEEAKQNTRESLGLKNNETTRDSEK